MRSIKDVGSFGNKELGRLLADYRYSAERLHAGLFRCSAAKGPAEPTAFMFICPARVLYRFF